MLLRTPKFLKICAHGVFGSAVPLQLKGGNWGVGGIVMHLVSRMYAMRAPGWLSG